MAAGVTQLASGVSQIPTGALPIGIGVTPARKFVMQIVTVMAPAEAPVVNYAFNSFQAEEREVP